jgi:hypothetical protein
LKNETFGICQLAVSRIYLNYKYSKGDFMFEFIKSLFKRKPVNTKEESKSPVLVHADIGESIVIKEVALADVKPKTRKPKATKLTEVTTEDVPVVAKGVKPAAKKTKKPTVKAEPAKIVQFVQPAPAKKKGRPKKDKV